MFELVSFFSYFSYKPLVTFTDQSNWGLTPISCSKKRRRWTTVFRTLQPWLRVTVNLVQLKYHYFLFWNSIHFLFFRQKKGIRILILVVQKKLSIFCPMQGSFFFCSKRTSRYIWRLNNIARFLKQKKKEWILYYTKDW